MDDRDAIPASSGGALADEPSGAGGVRPAANSADEPRGGSGRASSVEEHASASHIIRQWQGLLSPGVEDWVAAYTEHGEDRISLPTFDGDRVAIRILRVNRTPAVGGATLRGTVEGEEGSLVSLSAVGDTTAGSIHIPSLGLVYEVRPAADGAIYFSEINTAELGECQHCRDVPQPTRVSFNRN